MPSKPKICSLAPKPSFLPILLQAYCYLYNEWLKADTYFWVETLVTTSNITEWENKVTVECEETAPDSWAAKVEECKALRAYASEKGMKLADVTQAEVRATSLGLPGWAKLYDSRPAAWPKPGSDGSSKAANQASNKRKAETQNPHAFGDGPSGVSPKKEGEGTGGDGEATKRTTNKKDNTASKKERELKELLATEQSSDNCMAGVAANMAKDPGAWQWATQLVGTYKQQRGAVVQDYANNPAFQQFKVAALSPKETQKVKKQLGEDYIGKLVEFITTLGPKIQAMAETSYQIQQMANAKREATDSLRASSKPKARAKAKGKASKCKRGSSNASLPSSN